MNYDLTLGKGKDAQQISSNDLKGGIKKEDIKDEKMRSIFEALDDGNNILEQKEIDALNAKVQEAAAKDGDATNLSNREARKLIKSLGLKGFKVEDLFNFLSTVKQAGVNIEYQTRNAENPDEIVIKYKTDAEGNTVIERHNNENGTLVGTTIQDKNNNTVMKGADNRISGGKNEVGNYQRTYNADEGYTDTYEDGSIRNFDKNGKWISGISPNGITYENEYKEDGSYVRKCNNGEIQEYDNNNRLLRGTLPYGITYVDEYMQNGLTYENEYNADGSYTQRYINGNIWEYDKNNRLLRGTSYDGDLPFETKYNEDGSYTCLYGYGDNTGAVQEYCEYDKNGRLLRVKSHDGTTDTFEYHEDGGYTYNRSDGFIKEYDKCGRILSTTYAEDEVEEYTYGNDGKLKYREVPNKNGSKCYWGPEEFSDKRAQKTSDGDFKVSPKQGETFDDTMTRLGITDSVDQEMFKNANQKAYNRGYFLLTDPNKLYGEVYIPKALADKLDIENMLVDVTAEFNEHKQARKKPQMGV